MKTAAEIRTDFLNYFQNRNHTVVASSLLIPHNDPTLLFTNAGMVQFKGVFLGEERRDYCRAASSQKCVRAGGKHNDLENVGRTARHHTFFEMLGNFSFGDYFKQEAIAMAWEFLTGHLGIDRQKLWVTVYEDDDEAAAIWRDRVGVDPGRIARMGEKDNFWAMGDTGPCGPCSEIIIDQGEDFSCGRPGCAIGCDCDRYLELWNLVFMQFSRDERGIKTPLPRPSIDTGMGLERITAVVQGAASNYDTDLFLPLTRHVARIAEKKYGADPEHDISMRIIADHSRACAFLIGDGVLPSNEGRGYVLRRIMRRAARHGKKLGLSKPFLCDAARVVAHEMSGVYPELTRSLDYITRVVLTEEETHDDLGVWPGAREAVVVNAPESLAHRAGQKTTLGKTFLATDSRLKSLCRALRPHQWIKNLIVFVPVLTSHQLGNQITLIQAGFAFVAFCAAASAVYLLNDLLDLDADRHHATKCHRPFASGDLPLQFGLIFAPFLLLAALALSWFLSPSFTFVTAIYFFASTGYSWHLKLIALLDVLFLAGLYTLRLVAGHVATGIAWSPWLLTFSMFIFLSLALMKRFQEIQSVREQNGHQIKGRGYTAGHQSAVVALGIISGIAAVIVLGLYVNSAQVVKLYHHPTLLLLACPLLLVWIGRFWRLTYQGRMHDDPTAFAFKDWASYVIGALTLLVMWFATGK